MLIESDGYGHVTGSGTYEYGSEVTITATPDEHYHFVKWSDGDTQNPRTIFVTANTNLTANFSIDTHQVLIESDGYGHVTGSGTYEYGSEVTITATPDEHYHFVKWSDGIVENPRTLTITQDITLTAEFVLENTSVQDVVDSNVLIHSDGHCLHIEGINANYAVFDTSGRLIYIGRDSQLSLPHGIYIVRIGSVVKRVINN